MWKKILPVVLLLVLPVTSAQAQGSDGQVALPEGVVPQANEGSLYSGPYEVTKDGSLIYGGDVSFGCEELPAFAARRADAARTGGVALETGLDEAIGLCAEAGFLPERALATGASRGSGGGGLPETGGFVPVHAALLGAVAVSVAGALLVLRSGR